MLFLSVWFLGKKNASSLSLLTLLLRFDLVFYLSLGLLSWLHKGPSTALSIESDEFVARSIRGMLHVVFVMLHEGTTTAITANCEAAIAATTAASKLMLDNVLLVCRYSAVLKIRVC